MCDCNAKLAVAMIELMEEIAALRQEVEELKTAPKTTNVIHNHYHYRNNCHRTYPWYISNTPSSTSDTTRYLNTTSASGTFGRLEVT